MTFQEARREIEQFRNGHYELANMQDDKIASYMHLIIVEVYDKILRTLNNVKTLDQ